MSLDMSLGYVRIAASKYMNQGIYMNIINLRTEPRRATETRRVSDRRVVPYEFGSPKWIENIQRNYLAWPITDRRVEGRRNDERRRPDRRQRQLSEQLRSTKKHSKIILSREELKLIEDLYLDDLNDLDGLD